ncbi:unnamed protein product [Linum tenue]|uniref:Secreted protein n=1 Tax=Linum tenue TaxID=586396 RepID=A0AAV0KZ97_9ROSI|nr:unnamed protein product [Linum tenue]
MCLKMINVFSRSPLVVIHSMLLLLPTYRNIKTSWGFYPQSSHKRHQSGMLMKHVMPSPFKGVAFFVKKFLQRPVRLPVQLVNR